MADIIIRLCPGLPNPNDVRLCDPTVTTNTYLYTGSGVLTLDGAAVTAFVPASTGGGFLPKSRKFGKRKPIRKPVVFQYFATGRIRFSGSAPVTITHATVWESVIEAAWPTLKAPMVGSKVSPMVGPLFLVELAMPKAGPLADDEDILMLLEGLGF